MNNVHDKISQPTYKRQRFLLAFIDRLNEGIAMTNLQKLVFLQVMAKNSNYYDFIPYKYGPYSFQLKADVESLVRNGFLTYDGTYYHANEIRKQDCVAFAIEPAPERGTALIRKAYQSYPYYTIRSRILDRYFSDESVILKQLKEERQRYFQSEQVLFTIGYEGRTLENFMNVLLKNDVHTLCDVRRNPFSRKFGFSKDNLQHISLELGIKYIHWPELGIDSTKRKQLNSADDYRALFKDFEKNLSNLSERLNALYSCLCSDNRIALMCFEKDPEMCHRHVIRDYLCSLYPVRSVDL